MNTFKITKPANNSISLIFNLDYFLKNCKNATIDFNELEIEPTFTIIFDDKPRFSFDSNPIFDESEIAQFFNDDVLAALIAADSRFANDENPY